METTHYQRIMINEQHTMYFYIICVVFFCLKIDYEKVERS